MESVTTRFGTELASKERDPCLKQDEGSEPDLEQIADNDPQIRGQPQDLQEKLTDDPEYDPEASEEG